MKNFEIIINRGNGRYAEYNNNLDAFKCRMHQETSSISKEKKLKINDMDLKDLMDYINGNDNKIYRTLIMKENDRKYDYPCIELMEQMHTVEEKYIACRFFYLIDLAKDRIPGLKMIANAFFTRYREC
jgi:hypothetical protein